MTKDEFNRLAAIDLNEMIDELCTREDEIDDWILLFPDIICNFENNVVKGEDDLYYVLTAVMYLGYNIGKETIKDEDGVPY